MPESPEPVRAPAPAWPDSPWTVAELFAGVGGFRLALERVGWRVIWSDQWEPSTRRQHASDCYVERFGPQGHVCEDIHLVLDQAERGERDLPDHRLVVGGFPCQDYSVAKTLNQAHGLKGRKGVLWWEIERLLRLKRPPYLFLENVDRLLKSPAGQRGRDFAVMLASLSDLGYVVEWRVVNAADYGFPQKRRRVFIVGRRDSVVPANPVAWLYRDGILARALPVHEGPIPFALVSDFDIAGDLVQVSEEFNLGGNVTPFLNAGVMIGRRIWTRQLAPRFDGARQLLAHVLEPPLEVPPRFFVPEDQVEAWQYLKGAKREERHHRGSGAAYFYTEGAIPFPDPLDSPSRTILTGEGGSSPSRFKHLIADPADGRYRRLTPRELERLDGFPDDWTAGMPEAKRAFMMGNALVVGLVQLVGRELLEQARAAAEPAEPELVGAAVS